MTGSQSVVSPRLGFITLGCKVNQYETAYLAETASLAGLQITSTNRADFLVINTCTVTSRTDRQIRQLLRQAARLASPPRIIVTGCYAQRAPHELAAFPHVMAVLGNQEKALWPELLAAICTSPEPLLQVAPLDGPQPFAPMPVSNFLGHTRAFVKIQDGCNHFCSYCIVPAVRGPERSLPLNAVLEQVDRFLARGFRELVLTGINLSRYGQDLPGRESLLTLVRELRHFPRPARFRLSSLEPQDLAGDLLHELAAWPQFCPHFHLPLQSGAPAVLAAMQRTYQPQWFEALVQQIAGMFPQAAIGLDVMVGFPSETPADFAQTRNLLARLPIAYLHVFPFSARPGTPAAALPALPSHREIQARAKELRALGQEKKQAFFRRQIGQVAEVLVEGEVSGRSGWLQGLTSNYLRVHLPGPEAWINQVIGVKLQKSEGQVLIGAVST